MDPNTSSSLDFVQTIDIIYKIVILVVAAGGIFAFFFRGIRYCKRLRLLMSNLDVVATKATALMDKIVPRILQGLEKSGVIPENTLAEWTEFLSSANYNVNSPKQLNENGNKLLSDCGIKGIIDKNTQMFESELDAAKLTTALDVEEKAFYVLDNHKDNEIFKSLKVYIYNNSKVDVFLCLYVGSLYLRNIYLKKHADLQ